MKAGDRIKITKTPLEYRYFSVGDTAELTRQDKDGYWWADFDGRSWADHGGDHNDREFCVSQMAEFEEVQTMIDFDKRVQTKSGEPVEIITTEGREPWPIIGYRRDSDSDNLPSCWTKEGRISRYNSSDQDLENVPQKRSGWRTVIVEKDGNVLKRGGVFCDTREEAERFIGKSLDPGWNGVEYIEWTE